MKKSIIIVDNYYKNPHVIRKHIIGNVEKDIKVEKLLEKNRWHLIDLEYTYTDIPGLSDYDKTIMGRIYNFQSSHIEKLFKEELEQLLGKEIKQLSDMHSILTTCLSYPIPMEIASLDNYNEKYEEWVGIIFLTPDAPFDGGISIYNNIPYNINSIENILPYDKNVKQHIIDELNLKKFDIDRYWKVEDTIENVYNRLVLLKKDLFYKSTCNFGTDLSNTRLAQQFTFSVLCD
jgi:hypothetical protein